MKLSRCLSILFLFGLVLMLSACSGGKTQVMPDTESLNIPESFGTATDNRNAIAVYDALIDTENKTFTVTPVERNSQYHYPLTQLYPNVLQITGYGWTPNFWADIKLQHPLPGSGIDGFDPRVIAILPANTGVSFNYPALSVVGNNSVVLAPDGYTKLFDYLGDATLGNTNPFKAYFKSQLYRKWSNTVVTEETQRWQMNIAGFGGPLQFRLVVDVSTNYPNSPQPEIDNAPEPVAIEATLGLGLTLDGGSADITVTLIDWQGRMTIESVLVEAPELFNSTVSLDYSTSPNPNEYVYTGTIANEKLAPVGEYKFLVAACDQMTGIYVYKEYVALVNYSGNLIWTKRAGGTSDDCGYGITTLSDNSTVATGSFSGSATFGLGETNETVLNSAGDYDIFIAQYNPDGTLSWAKRAGGTNSTHEDTGLAITMLSDNSTVVSGYFYGSATFGQDEANQTVLNSAGDYDIFIARYNPDGTLSWAKRAGGISGDVGNGITTLSDNSTVATGYFFGSATFGQDEINEKILWSAGGANIFIARYNPDGTLAWAKSAGGGWGALGSGITTLLDNSTVVTGYFGDVWGGSATFGAGEANQTVLWSAGNADIFIARYNPNGTLAWAKRAGGADFDYGDSGSEITSLSDNSTVVTGYFYDSATFGPGEPNQIILRATRHSDIFIAQYNPNGTLAWAKRAGGITWDIGYGITTLLDDSTVVTGRFGGTATFGPGEPNQTILTSAGGYNFFIARYNPNGTLSWAKSAGGTDSVYGYGTTTLSNNSTVATGFFKGSATFGQDEPNETVLVSAGENDIFIARFKP